MTIPKNFGISKISMMRGAEDNRYAGEEGRSSSRGKWDTSMQAVSCTGQDGSSCWPGQMLAA